MHACSMHSQYWRIYYVCMYVSEYMSGKAISLFPSFFLSCFASMPASSSSSSTSAFHITLTHYAILYGCMNVSGWMDGLDGRRERRVQVVDRQIGRRQSTELKLDFGSSA